MHIYILKDLDDGEIMVGNEIALTEYARYLNDEIAENEDKIEIKSFKDVLEVIEKKNISIKSLDIGSLSNMRFNVF